MYISELVTFPGGLTPFVRKWKQLFFVSVFESISNITEIINDAIAGIFVVLIYYPFICFFLNPDSWHHSSILLETFKTPYESLLKMSGKSLIVIFLFTPVIGMINRAIIYTFVDTYQKKIINNFLLKKVIKSLKSQQNLKLDSNELLEKLKNAKHPCWQLEGTMDFANYRVWLIRKREKKVYWDWEHFLDWAYKVYYQTLFLSLELYLILIIIIICQNYEKLENIKHLDLFGYVYFFGLLIVLSLYREHTRHHIAWIGMDQRFYLEYLLEEKSIPYNIKKAVINYINEEKYNNAINLLSTNKYTPF